MLLIRRNRYFCLMQIEIQDLTALTQAAATLLSAFPEQRIFLFYGEMGAGKTTFIHALCKQLHVQDQTSSPTFSIVNEYASPQGPIYHFDFYRLKNESEAFDLGYEEYFYSGQHCLIEWPEKIPNLIPPSHVVVNLKVNDDHSRTLTIEQHV